jgi:F-type H+-transporting ATPase subunit a
MDHITTEILGKTVHADTLYFAWACMAVILLVSFLLTVGISEDTSKYGSRQHFVELVFNFIRGIARDQIGKRGDYFVFLLGSIFIFILVNYYAGLIPWKMGSLFEWWPQLPSHELAVHADHAVHHADHAVAHHGHPWHGASPCADINIPAGMALIVVLTYFISGAAIGGFKYVQMYLPINFSKKGVSLNLMCLIELMDLIVRPLTLSLRLFANTVAGETLLLTFIGLCALILPAAILGFEMAVGLLQSFLFMILSTVYIATAVQHAEHLAHDAHH